MSQLMGAKITRDHEIIQQWVKKRKGKPVANLEESDRPEENIAIKVARRIDRKREFEISWQEFFDKFRESNLGFLYQEYDPDGEISCSCKILSPWVDF